MVQVNHSDHMEDNRFKTVRNIAKQETPSVLHWCFEDDYFSEELLGFSAEEVARYAQVSRDAFQLFERATEKMINDNKLSLLGIPPFFYKAIENSWKKRADHPFLLGRFDVNGNLDSGKVKVIEFNADTCSTLP